MPENSFKKIDGRCDPDLTGKYQRSIKNLMDDSFPGMFHAVVPLVFSRVFCFCPPPPPCFHSEFHFLSFDAGCDGCHA